MTTQKRALMDDKTRNGTGFSLCLAKRAMMVMSKMSERTPMVRTEMEAMLYAVSSHARDIRCHVRLT